jgi:(E)-4-hydroxy-3-methylbut-2-enyl-diphosphate synthase
VNIPVRKCTNVVKVGRVSIGGDHPITIQSMTNTKTADPLATLRQIAALTTAGCELIRVAIPDRDSVSALKIIVKQSRIPVIADIHFDYRLAIESINSGAAKVRINPGNIGGKDRLLEIARHAEAANIPIRIGVNAGSLEKNLLEMYRKKQAEALVESALGYIEILESIGFAQIIVSLKASEVYTTIQANRLFSNQVSYPLHLGVTEAGPPETGTIKSAIGIGALLAEGIGDTVRVSLTANPVQEIVVSRRILQALGLRHFETELVSCPTCGRCETDLVKLTQKVETMIKGLRLPLRIAVMGCAVNGPGEAREADLGICAGKQQGLVFRKGKVIKTVKLGHLLEAFREELEKEITSFNGWKEE